MNIAVFDHQSNYGGGKRFLLNLLCSLAAIDGNLKITLFCNLPNASDSDEFNELTKRGIKIQPLLSLQPPLESVRIHIAQKTIVERALKYISRRIRPEVPKQQEPAKPTLEEEISVLSKEFDLAYFPWPYLMKSPKTQCPKVATFHDFNFKYFFGTFIFNEQQLQLLNGSLEHWMKDTYPIVSTHFMENEIKCFYPGTKPVNVIHLASLNLYNNDDLIPDEEFEYKHLLNLPYIVFPVHLTSHKNIANVVAAISLVNQDALRIRLVLTGKYTETIKGNSSYLGLKFDESEGIDVLGLGYISDKQMHYLQQNAFAVINASFYEAGNGVGLDAWPMGVPVIQSNIPAFEEHLNLQGFKAFTFDPRDANSISKAIEECLLNETKRNSYIKESLVASKELTWEVTANKYLEVFKMVLAHKV